MAVWMQIIGMRKLKSIDSDKLLISKVLDKIKNEYKSFAWKIDSHTETEHFKIMTNNQTLKIYFDNPNFLEFSGCDLFQAWFKFADKGNEEITNEIRNIFKKIAFEYGITELIYFSEWFFELGEIRNKMETFEDLTIRISNYPEHKRKELYGLKSYEYFVEKIGLVANNT